MKIFVTLFLALLCAFPSRYIQANSQTRDAWRSVRTNNLFVIGNADAEKLRQVATWLEFFHGAFGRLVSRNVIDLSVPTTVVLFRDEGSFQPFKPLYQGRPANVSGYFQPGDDVNYIAISLEPSERDPFSTAFHEYIHAHVNDHIPGAPLWLNEGLAELYGSLQFSNGEAVLGTPLMHYIRYLRQQELLPLNTLFSINTSSEHYNESDKTGIFYGQSWALVHYLMLGDRGRQDQFKRFLQQIIRGDSSAKAIEDTYGVKLSVIEQELLAYIRRGDFPAQRIVMGNPEAYTAYTAMQRSSLSEGEANYYLGDLLLHIGRPNDAERYFKHAVALDPGFIPTHAALGMLYVQQRRYADAKRYLEKAVSATQNHLTHYLYAYTLSREGISPTGRIREYSPATAAVMREQLWRAIKLAPNHAPSYYLLALINLVTGERLDEALSMAQRARQLEPSKSSNLLLLAQVHLRRADHAAARPILEQLRRDADKSVRDEAQELLASMDETSASSQTRSASAPAISGALISEPVQPGKTRILGGESGGVAINDGQTIERSGSLPAVDEVLSKYLEAMGGAAAINAVSSRVIRGTLDIPGVSRGGSFETYAQAPNKLLTIMEAHPMGMVKLGFNGRSGWAWSTAGLRLLKNVELASLRREADFYAPVRLKSLYQKVTLAGTSKIGYREVYVVDFQPAAGEADRVYFDVKTFLPARANSMQTVGAVSIQVEIYYDDWREVDGIKFPFSIGQSFSNLTMSFTVKEIKHNVPIEAKMFEPTPGHK